MSKKKRQPYHPLKKSSSKKPSSRLKSLLTGQSADPNTQTAEVAQELAATVKDSVEASLKATSWLRKRLLRLFTSSGRKWQRLWSSRNDKKNQLQPFLRIKSKVQKQLETAKKTGSKSKKQSGPKQKPRLRTRILKWSLIGLAGLVGITVLTGIGIMVFALQDLPSPRKLTNNDNFAVSTQIFDRDGELLYEIFADENRVPIAIDQVPEHVIQATIAIEDENFYRHFGIDLVGITRAALNNLQGGRLEGGSTITQQLVKNALLTQERSIERKIREALLAIATEIIYSKEQIMEMYLNYISYGGTAVGIESAAQHYFDKPATELSLAEAALLAGLPQAPSIYSPFGSDPTRAKTRQAQVLRQMVENDFITAAEAEAAQAEVLQFAISRTDIQAPHFVFYVRDYLYEEYGVETVEKGGLRVTTTLDLDLQEVVQASVSAEIAQLERYRVGNGAAMVVKPNTGEILAMVGSKDYFNEAEDGQVNVALALRQPGSSIKPIMYATAFQEKVLNPGTVLLDVPTCFTTPGQKPYCPKNYDGSFKGPVTVRQALGNSLNIPAVKGLRLIGIEPFVNQATAMGITTWTDLSRYGWSLTLGGGEVRMIDMAQTFSVLANQGVKTPLTPILKIEDFRGNTVAETDLEERLADLEYLTLYDDEPGVGDLDRVMDRAPAYLTSHIMQDNNARIAAFGPRSELVIPDQIVSAKTGTTNDLKDNWTVGFTPEFLVISWVGNNDSSPMNPYVVSGVTGAAPIFNDVMSYILAGREPVWQEKPADVAQAGVCASGLPPEATPWQCSPRYDELYWQQGQPSQSRNYTKEIWIKPDGTPLQPGEPTDDLRLEERTVLGDPLTQSVCSDCGGTTEDGQALYSRQTVPHDFDPTQVQDQ